MVAFMRRSYGLLIGMLQNRWWITHGTARPGALRNVRTSPHIPQDMLLNSEPVNEDLGYLFLRVGAGGSMFWLHGLPKVMYFTDRMDTFSDPFGISPVISLVLIIVAEFLCSALLVLGLWTRLATIPLIIGMAVIVFMVHGDDPFKEKELAVIFLIIFITLFFTGSGRYSVDRISFR